jgi:hypothetical protein
MHFHIIFLNFHSQGVHSRHFSHHFSFHFQFPFVCFSAKYMKMSKEWDWKWAERWPKNGYCEQPYCLFTQCLKCLLCNSVLFLQTGQSLNQYITETVFQQASQISSLPQCKPLSSGHICLHFSVVASLDSYSFPQVHCQTHTHWQLCSCDGHKIHTVDETNS